MYLIAISVLNIFLLLLSCLERKRDADGLTALMQDNMCDKPVEEQCIL